MDTIKLAKLKAKFPCKCCGGAGEHEPNALDCPGECYHCHTCGGTGINWMQAIEVMEAGYMKEHKRVVDENNTLRQQILNHDRYIQVEVEKRVKEFEKIYEDCPPDCPIRKR